MIEDMLSVISNHNKMDSFVVCINTDVIQLSLNIYGTNADKYLHMKFEYVTLQLYFNICYGYVKKGTFNNFF